MLDDPDIGRKAGTEVLRQYVGTEVLALLRSLGSPGEMFRMYPAISAKQSTVTRSEVLEVGDRHALIAVVTPNYKRDPLFCGYTLGALSEFPVRFGMAQAKVEEVECQTRGDSRCLIRVDWDPTSSKDSGLQHEVEILTGSFSCYEALRVFGICSQGTGFDPRCQFNAGDNCQAGWSRRSSSVLPPRCTTTRRLCPAYSPCRLYPR